MENKTDCGQKCFELQDTEHALAVEKENNQKLQAEIKRLTAQIEKMKCCENCKHINDSNTDYYCEDCKRFANETNIEKWELAE